MLQYYINHFFSSQHFYRLKFFNIILNFRLFWVNIFLNLLHKLAHFFRIRIYTNISSTTILSAECKIIKIICEWLYQLICGDITEIDVVIFICIRRTNEAPLFLFECSKRSFVAIEFNIENEIIMVNNRGFAIFAHENTHKADTTSKFTPSIRFISNSMVQISIEL